MIRTVEDSLSGVNGLLVTPDRPARAAALVLAGSSGRVAEHRVRLLARHGVAAASFQWFGGPGVSPSINEVPLETFTPILDRLAAISPNLAWIGLSKSAEAGLLVAARDERIGVVAALAPSHVVWANLGPDGNGDVRPQRSSWTVGGRPVPFVPYDDDWEPTDTEPPISYVGYYDQSLRTHADRVAAATIPVERIAGAVLVAGGGDDRVWNSTASAERIRSRRAEHGLGTTVVTHPDAGHRIVFPGESAATGGRTDMARGGNPEADAALGAAVWSELVWLLGLTA